MTLTTRLLALTLPALLVTIGLKTAFEVDYYPLEREVRAAFQPDQAFGSTRFQFSPYSEPGEFIGVNDACVVIVGLSGRDGDADSIFLRRYEPTGARILYLYRDIITPSAPYLRAQIDNYVQRLRVAIGQRPVPRLMLHLAASDACRSEHFAPLVLQAR